MKESLFYKLVLFIFGIIFAIIMILLCFGDKTIKYVTKNVCPVPNWIIMLLAVVMLTALLFLSIKFYSKFSKIIDKFYFKIIMAGTILVFAVQCYISYGIYFYTGWDCEQIYINASAMAITGSDIAGNWYFLRYPNNITLLYIISVIVKIGNKFGQDYFLCIVVSILCVAISGVFASVSVVKLTKSKTAGIVGWVMFLLVFGFSPWLTIPYSDTYSIAIAVIIFYIYTTISDDNPDVLKRFIIGMLAFLGMSIKPTVVIVLMAIIIMDMWKFLYDTSRRKLIKIAALLIIAISYILSSMIGKQIRENVGYEEDKDQQFSITHFLMMGLNEESQGMFSGDDVEYTASFDTYKEKQQANIKEVKERLSDMGFGGCMQLLAEKTLINYNDGTFAWGGEGNFYSEILEDKSMPFIEELRSFYYGDGDNYEIFMILSQLIWLAVLISISGVLIKNDDINQNYITVLLMSIVGITVFLYMFEARARYLICYLPLYVVCAVVGLYNIRQKLIYSSQKRKYLYIENEFERDMGDYADNEPDNAIYYQMRLNMMREEADMQEIERAIDEALETDMGDNS